MTRRPAAARWNHNTHYHRVVLGALPADCQRALDVGCGEGTLARQLTRLVPRVVGLDRHEPSIALARQQGTRSAATPAYVVGDLLAHPFEQASFDLVASVATLHHMAAREGLSCLAGLVRPGGVLAVVGLACSSTRADYAFDATGAVLHRLQIIRAGGYWEPPSPLCWPPPASFRQMRELAGELLPGVRYRRHALWRYSLVWRRPVGWCRPVSC